MLSNYLIVHKSILPDYYEKVLECRRLMESGKVREVSQAVKQVGMVVEGMYTADAAYRLSKKLGVEMPITEAIYKVVQGEVDAGEAVHTLMTRAKKGENETLVKDLL